MTMLGSQDRDLWRGAQPGGLARPAPLLRALRPCHRAGQGRLAAFLHERGVQGGALPARRPVTIMLVEHQGNLLLGRQPRFPRAAFGAGRVRGAGQIDRGARWRAKCRRKRA
jgi:NAD+ diphosphatase